MKTTKQKIYRIIAAYLLLNMLAELFAPVAAYALTNGPGQPEFQSFEPAGSTEMVNLFTGDFSYNIPLMTVPGPNGGYPINLAYHAGIGMEQEASWVGLGWNINAGAINRSMRGLPDDFKGDEVIKNLHFKPSNTLTLNYGENIISTKVKEEKLGFNAKIDRGVQVYYNNNRGIGFQFSGNFAISSAEHNSSFFSSPLRINLTSSSDGIGVNTGYSFSHTTSSSNISQSKGIGVTLQWGSREGIDALNLNYSNTVHIGNAGATLGAGVSFVSNCYMPSSNPEMEGFIANIGLEIGTNNNADYEADKITTLLSSYSRTYIKYPSQHYNSYGYLYNEHSNGVNDNLVLEDINRDKNNPPSRQSKTLGVPIAAYDLYSVSGQGMGGTFRPYRSDVGIYTEPNVVSNIYGGTVNAEWGTPELATTRAKLGLDGSFMQSRSSSGMWHDEFWTGLGGDGWGPIDDFQFQGLNPLTGEYAGSHAYEPFYFKMAGELTSSPTDHLDFMGGNSAARFQLHELFESGTDDICPRPEIVSSDLHLGSNSISLSTSFNHRATREKTVTRNISRTHGQMERFTTQVPENIYSTRNSFPATGGTATPTAYDYSAKPDHHLAEFTETGADGSRYMYGIPVYADGTKEVMFAKNGFPLYPTNYSFSYTQTEASLSNNEQGTDQLYSSTETPGYAESYLLTEILSPDYVDVTGDGPTEDDLGYYTKFNYVLADASYKWRAPYWGAILNSGFLSNQTDDRLSYMYGEKEIYFLHSIETKTHVACFFLEDDARKDAHGAVAEYVLDSTIYQSQIANADKMWALDHISLYSKADPDYGTTNATPIKSVNFDTDYILCPGVDNNENSSGGTGKLTLLGIHFTYRDNDKGKLSPYVFSYGNSTDQDINPTYDPLGNDRWGTYKPQLSGNYRNNENPYTNQLDRSEANQNAAAWCLRQITMPSGSVVTIEYEADDYSYVQDKKAMQMCRVIGFGEDDAGNTNDLTSDVVNHLNKKNTRVYFELNQAISYSATDKNEQVAKYLEGISEMYFKMFLKLRKPHGNPTGDDLYDYVDGFCKIKSTGYGVVNDGQNDHRYAYLTIETVERDDYPALAGANVHPMEKAAWQHMYLERPDLFATPDIESGAVANLVTATIGIIGEIPRAVAPYITANVRGWGNTLNMNTSTQECDIRPSYIRLNTPDGKKVGGGHRVKEITIHDDWDEISNNAGQRGTYGQSYSYQLADGTSSGVASYEPLMGGEENAMCMPIRYNSDNLVKKDQAFYVMEPIGESYYPASVVGYSRVIVSSIVTPGTGETVTSSRTGITEYEFYTAKDYPVVTHRTDLQKTWFPVPVVIPFVGSISYNMRGFSQGYSIELNDMHGKLKAVATYPSYANLVGAAPMPIRRVFYKYNGGYNGNTGNILSSTVDVLTSDGVYSQANLGETYDFFFDMKQHSNETQEIGLQFNITANTAPPYDFVPTAMPTINISKSLYRSAVAMKVIYRTGILIEVETIDDGARSTARNLMFDAETGAPLLTVVENEFERPVYTYNFAAHWAYEGMQGAYKNQGARFNTLTASGGSIPVTNADQYFYPGDEIMYIPSTGAGTMYWVDLITSNTVHLIDASGTAIGNVTGDFIIHRSGRRNLQSVANGVIVSLSNPVTDRNFPLFEDMSDITNLQENTNYSFTDCATGNTITYKVFLSGMPANMLHIETVGESACRSSIQFGTDFSLTSIGQLARTIFIRHGNQVEMQIDSDNNPVTPAVVVYGTWVDPSNCFNTCMDNVLHASAVRFAENWSASTIGHQQEINFSDVGLTVTSTNDYKYGLRGVWRTHSNYLYQVDRKQTTASTSGTDISKDGTYNNFVLYNWEIAPQDNTNWAFVSAVTRYSPYGYALETRDALGIYSTSMYGYDNTKQVSAASNCQYFEMAFDGFEDYSSQYTGHGHMLFNSLNQGSPIGLSSTYAHTGTKSLGVDAGGDGQLPVACDGIYSATQQHFECQPGQEYFLSVWARAVNGGTPAVLISDGVNPTITSTPDLSQSPIEGWRKIDVRFVAPLSGSITITLQCQTSGTAFFDDLRIQPFKSAMVSYVYDPQTHWLLAELDNRNFATFYNYDEEGALVQVKQETEKGIFTVQTSRGNIKR